MKRIQRIACTLLAVVMCLTMLPVSAGAASTLTITSPSDGGYIPKSNPGCVKWTEVTGAGDYRINIINSETGARLTPTQNLSLRTSTSYSLSSIASEISGYPKIKIWVGAYASLSSTTLIAQDFVYATFSNPENSSNNPGHNDLEDDGQADMEDELTAPDDITVTALDSSRIELEWSKVSGATGYKIYRSSKSTKSSFTNVIATIKSGSTLSFIDTNLSANTKYYYRITATKGSSESELSGYDYDTTDPLGPAAPKSVVVEAQGPNSIKISWGKVAGAIGYKVYRSASSSKSGFTNAIATINSDSTTSYIDKGLSANTKYYYRVTAFDRNYESELSSYDYDYTDEEVKAVSAPSSVNTAIHGVGHIEVTWSKVSDATGYKVYRSTSTDESSAVCVKELSDNSTLSYTDSGLSAGTQYWYWVKAVKNSEESNFSNKDGAVTAKAAKLATPNISPTFSKTVLSGSGNYVTTYFGKASTDVANDAALTINWVDTEGAYKFAVKVLDGEPDTTGFNDVGVTIYNETASCSYTDNVYTLTKETISAAAGKWIKVYLGCDYWNCHYYFKVTPVAGGNNDVGTVSGDKVFEELSDVQEMISYQHSSDWSKVGIINYVEQKFSKNNSGYYYASYWGSTGGKSLCTRAASAMALSYLGKTAYPKYIAPVKEEGNSIIYDESVGIDTPYTDFAAKYSCEVSLFATPNLQDFETLYNRYANDTVGKYSPIVIHSLYSGNGMHSFTIIGKSKDGYYWTIDSGMNEVGIGKLKLAEKAGKLCIAEYWYYATGDKKFKQDNKYSTEYPLKSPGIWQYINPNASGDNPGNLKLSTSAVNLLWNKDNEASVKITGTEAYTTTIAYDGLTEAQKTTYNNWDWLKCTASGNTIWVRTKYPNYANTARKATVTVKTDNNSISFTVTQNKCGEDAPNLRSVKTIKENLGSSVTLTNGYDIGTLKNETLPLTIETTNVRRITVQTKKYGSTTTLRTTPGTITNEDGTNGVTVQLVDGAGTKLADGKYQLDIWYSNSATENDKWSQCGKFTVYFSIGDQSQSNGNMPGIPTDLASAKAMVIFSEDKSAKDVEIGKIRHIAQNRGDPHYCTAYWKNSDYDLTSNSGAQCTRAVYSMALSYLGLDYTPVAMSSLAGKKILPDPYNDASNVYKDDITDKIVGLTASSGSLDKLFENYKRDSSYSPVYFYFDKVAGNNHAILIFGQKDSDTYYALDPSHSGNNAETVIHVIEVKVDLNKKIITACDFSDYVNAKILGCAQWKYGEDSNRTYTITYDYGYSIPNAKIYKNGVAFDYAEKEYGKDYAIKSPMYTKPGYIFKGWAEHPDHLTVKYAPGATYTRNSDLYLYAVWEKAEDAVCTITYNANGGSGAPAAQIAQQGKTIRLSRTVPKLSGYKFDGWSLNQNGSGVKCNAGAYLSVATGTTSISLYATWKEVEQTAVRKGDVDLDGDVDTKDYLKVRLYVKKKTTLSSEALIAADVNNDGRISVADVNLIRKMR